MKHSQLGHNCNNSAFVSSFYDVSRQKYSSSSDGSISTVIHPTRWKQYRTSLQEKRTMLVIHSYPYHRIKVDWWIKRKMQNRTVHGQANECAIAVRQCRVPILCLHFRDVYVWRWRFYLPLLEEAMIDSVCCDYRSLNLRIAGPYKSHLVATSTTVVVISNKHRVAVASKGVGTFMIEWHYTCIKKESIPISTAEIRFRTSFEFLDQLVQR